MTLGECMGHFISFMHAIPKQFCHGSREALRETIVLPGARHKDLHRILTIMLVSSLYKFILLDNNYLVIIILFQDSFLFLSTFTGKSDTERKILATREKEKGNEAFQSGHYSEALTFYCRSIELDPKAAAVYNNRALAGIKCSQCTH